MNNAIYTCRNCQWEGSAAELDTDTVETCMGPDVIETCPKCGSPDIKIKVA